MSILTNKYGKKTVDYVLDKEKKREYFDFDPIIWLTENGELSENLIVDTDNKKLIELYDTFAELEHANYEARCRVNQNEWKYEQNKIQPSRHRLKYPNPNDIDVMWHIINRLAPKGKGKPKGDGNKREEYRSMYDSHGDIRLSGLIPSDATYDYIKKFYDTVKGTEVYDNTFKESYLDLYYFLEFLKYIDLKKTASYSIENVNACFKEFKALEFDVAEKKEEFSGYVALGKTNQKVLKFVRTLK